MLKLQKDFKIKSIEPDNDKEIIKIKVLVYYKEKDIPITHEREKEVIYNKDTLYNLTIKEIEDIIRERIERKRREEYE